MKLAILTSHPVQYYSPLFRELSTKIDLHVFFAHRATEQDQARAGFGTEFEWDVDLTGGFPHTFLQNVARRAGVHHFFGCNTPDIVDALRDGGFDALLVTGWGLYAYWQGIRAARQLGIPVIVRGDSHLDTPRHHIKLAIKALLYPALLRQFDAACYVGKRSRAYYLRYHYPDTRLFRSPHCVDINWFAARATPPAAESFRQSHDIPQDVKLILFAGKLDPEKRVDDLVRAISHLERGVNPYHLVIAGSGREEGRLRDLALALSCNVHFLGFLNQSEMPAAYAAADLLVLPSSSETWGLVCNEALACGTPVAISDAVGSAPDFSQSRAVGVFPVGNSSALVDSISRLCSLENAADLAHDTAKLFSLSAAAEGIVAAMESFTAEAQMRSKI